MIITGLITLGVSVAFWSVVPLEFMAGMVEVDIRQIYKGSSSPIPRLQPGSLRERNGQSPFAGSR